MNTTNTFNSNNPGGRDSRKSPVSGLQSKGFLGALSLYVRLSKSLLLLVFLTGLISCTFNSPTEPENNRPATNIVIVQGESITIKMGTIATNGRMIATVYPLNHTDGSITWISSNTQYITINSNTGLYNAVAAGDATIAAQVGKALATINVNMFNQPQTQYVTTNFNIFVTVTNSSIRFFSNVITGYINITSNYLQVPYTTNGYATIWLSNTINKRINTFDVASLPYRTASFSTTNLSVFQIYIETNTSVRPSIVSNFFSTNTANTVMTNIDLTNDDLSIYSYSSNLITTTVLSEFNLSGRNLSYLNLESFELDGANLTEANLRGANLRDVNLRDTDLRGANLRDADLSDVYLAHTYLSNADLRDANMLGANISDADLTGVRHNHNYLGYFDLIGTNLESTAITYYQEAFWVTDRNNDKVYQYFISGNLSSVNFALTSDNDTPYGITYYNNAFWVMDNSDNKVYQYSTTGDYLSSFNLSSDNVSPLGITYYDNAFWVLDWDNNKVHKYSTSGNPSSSGSFDLNVANDAPSGITYFDNNFWVVDRTDIKVYKYSASGTYRSSFDLSGANSFPYGLTYYNNAFWVVDRAGVGVYPYLAVGTEEPDLSISDVRVNDSIVTPGQSFTLSVRVNNSGTGGAGPTTLTYYRSTDSIIGTLDTPVGTEQVPSLNRGAFSLHSSSVTFPSSGESYYYGACVSAAAGETSTANKCSPGVLVKTNGEFNLTSENETPRGIVYHDDALWVVDKYDDKVYKYTVTGIYLSSFDLHNDNTAPVGITYGENAFWVANDNNDKVYKYSTTWEYQSSFDITGAARGIVYTGTDLWVVDTDSDKVYTYSTAGEYQSSFDLDDVNASPYGIALGKGSYWVGDNNDDKVYKYSTIGEYQSSFEISSDNTDPRGVAYYDNALWVVDWEDDKVYWYPVEGDTEVPDIVISDVSVSDSNLLAGQSFTLSVVVNNSGIEDAGSITLTYYRSTDSIIGTLDTPLNTTQVPSLSRGAFSAHSNSFTFPSSGDSYYYGACVSIAAGETSTANKCSPGVLVINDGEFNLHSDNRNPHGITYHDDAFWVVDTSDDKVYKYTVTGIYLSSFDLHSGNKDPIGIAYGDNALWVADDDTDDRVYKYSTTGVYQSRFDLTGGNDDPRGIVYTGTDLWVADTHGDKVYTYSTTGDYQSSFDLHSANEDPYGIALGKGSYWVADDDTDDKVYKYSITGNYQSSVDLSSGNDHPRGVAYYDNALWVVDYEDDKVYLYPVEEDTEVPDIVISDVSVSDSNLLAGQSFTLSVVVNNSGIEDAGSITLTYYRSTDSIIGTLDTPLNTTQVPSLSRGAFSAHSNSFTFPSSGDSYYYGACVSIAAGETSTANKCSPGVLVINDGEFNLHSDNRNPHGITYHDDAFWVVDTSDDKVYKYTVTGIYLSSFDLHSGNKDPIGIAYGDNAFWVADDDTDDRVYKYSTTGVYQSRFDLTSGNDDPKGIVYTGTDLWVADTHGDKVYTYSTTEDYQFSFDLHSANEDPYGIALGKGSYWVADDDTDDKVYKYSITGNYQSSVDLSSGNDHPRGVAYYDNALWVVDYEDDKVYLYPVEGDTEVPDIVISDVSVSDNSVFTSQSFTLSVVVNNSGIEDAGSITLTYYRSTDSIIGTLDTPLNTTQVPSLSRGAFSAHSNSFTFPSSGDSYYYGACVSVATGETSTANKCSPGVLVTNDGGFNLHSDNENSHGITYHDGAFWVVDNSDDKVYQYSPNGNYLSSFALHSGNKDPIGIAYGDNAFWVADDDTDDRLYKYSTNWDYQSRFNLTGGNDDPRGIVYTGTDLWVADTHGDKVYTYSTAGDYQSSFDLHSANEDPYGIALGKGSYWVADDDTDDKVYKYSITGNYQSSFDLHSDNTATRGVAYYDNAFWVVDWHDDKVYWYSLD